MVKMPWRLSKPLKKNSHELKSGLPSDVKIVPVYDRSSLIKRAIDNLTHKLLEEILIVALVCALFLFHTRSALVAVFTLPTAILMAFIIMQIQGINANIMSLGGIAIAIGAMVDAAIIMIENAHKHIEHENQKHAQDRLPHWEVDLTRPQRKLDRRFVLVAFGYYGFLYSGVYARRAGRAACFKPLAFTKTYSMAAAAILAITIVPILMGFFIRGKIPEEDETRLIGFLFRCITLSRNWFFGIPKMIIMRLSP